MLLEDIGEDEGGRLTTPRLQLGFNSISSRKVPGRLHLKRDCCPPSAVGAGWAPPAPGQWGWGSQVLLSLLGALFVAEYVRDHIAFVFNIFRNEKFIFNRISNGHQGLGWNHTAVHLGNPV